MRSTIQNSKFHAMVDDIARQVKFCGRRWRAESWKRILIECWLNVERDEAEAKGDPDPFPDASMLVMCPDGRSIVYLGKQTRTLSSAQMSDLIESTAAFGAEMNVVWSEKTKKAEDE